MTLSPPRQTSPAKEKKFCSSSNHDMCNAHTRTNTRGRANTVQIVYVVTLSRTRDSKRTFFHLSRSSFFVRASLSRLPFTTKKNIINENIPSYRSCQKYLQLFLCVFCFHRWRQWAPLAQKTKDAKWNRSTEKKRSKFGLGLDWIGSSFPFANPR